MTSQVRQEMHGSTRWVHDIATELQKAIEELPNLERDMANLIALMRDRGTGAHIDVFVDLGSDSNSQVAVRVRLDSLVESKGKEINDVMERVRALSDELSSAMTRVVTFAAVGSQPHVPDETHREEHEWMSAVESRLVGPGRDQIEQHDAVSVPHNPSLPLLGDDSLPLGGERD